MLHQNTLYITCTREVLLVSWRLYELPRNCIAHSSLSCPMQVVRPIGIRIRIWIVKNPTGLIDCMSTCHACHELPAVREKWHVGCRRPCNFIMPGACLFSSCTMITPIISVPIMARFAKEKCQERYRNCILISNLICARNSASASDIFDNFSVAQW